MSDEVRGLVRADRRHLRIVAFVYVVIATLAIAVPAALAAPR